MVVHALAECGFSARVFFANRATDPVETVTRFMVSTVFVILANTGDAGDQRIPLGTSRTLAFRNVGVDNAFSPFATGLRLTGI